MISLLSDILEAFATALTLLALAWVLIFGGVGVVLAHSRDQSGWAGLLWGLLGPVGWWAICDRGEEAEEEAIAVKAEDWHEWSEM